MEPITTSLPVETNPPKKLEEKDDEDDYDYDYDFLIVDKSPPNPIKVLFLELLLCLIPGFFFLTVLVNFPGSNFIVNWTDAHPLSVWMIASFISYLIWQLIKIFLKGNNT